MGLKRRSQKRDEESALKYVSRLLKYRLRSEEEVRRRLLRMGYPEEVVDEVIEKLKGSKILDDERFAYLFAKDELEIHFHGPYVIRRKLKELGVDEEIVEIGIEKALKEADLSEKVKSLFEKYKDLRKVKEVLFRRGFDPSIVDEMDLEWR